jgi:hypothetical protein
MISPLQRLALSTARPSLPVFRQTRTFAIRSSLHQNVTSPPPPPLSPPHAAAEPVTPATPVTPKTPVESPEMVRKRLPPRKPLVIRPTGPELTWLDYVQRGIVWTCVALTVSFAGPRSVWALLMVVMIGIRSCVDNTWVHGPCDEAESGG